MKTKEDILRLVEEEDVEFIRLQFTDMFGFLKNIAVTPNQLEWALDHGYMFKGSALFGKYGYEKDDLYLHPDLDTFVILPWRPQSGKVARIICDICREDGTIYECNPRAILQRVMKITEEKGYCFQVDPDCEFFLFNTDENGCPTTITHENAGFMDVGPTDMGENARRELVLNLEEMGFEVESSHHEVAPSQHEIDFKAAEPLPIADSIITFKSAVRSIVKRFGLHATFMPKPRSDMAGSGMRLNISAYKDGKNLFRSDENEDISQELKWFMGGILHYAPAMCAVTNPLVNSYKRLTSGFDAPNEIGWARKNVNGLLKVQRKKGEDTKVSLRFPDPSANPYLAVAVCLAAGVEGIEKQMDPGLPIPECYEKQEKLKELPGSLREAVTQMEESEFMERVIGKAFVDIYTDAKMQEWNAYMADVSKWELDEYLNKI